MSAEPLQPMTAIRRWGDSCFHLVDEVVEEGFILSGHLVRREDVLEVRTVAAADPGPPGPKTGGAATATSGAATDPDLAEPASGGTAPDPRRAAPDLGRSASESGGAVPDPGRGSD